MQAQTHFTIGVVYIVLMFTLAMIFAVQPEKVENSPVKVTEVTEPVLIPEEEKKPVCDCTATVTAIIEPEVVEPKPILELKPIYEEKTPPPVIVDRPPVHIDLKHNARSIDDLFRDVVYALPDHKTTIGCFHKSTGKIQAPNHEATE